jgi:hypothetical protein
MSVVLVTANLNTWDQIGSKIEVTVASVDGATNLQNGILVSTPLLGADKEVYALAAGRVSTGGFVAAGDAATVQKNHPTTGVAYGVVEKRVPQCYTDQGFIRLLLRDPDYETASRIKQAIEHRFPGSCKIIEPGIVRVIIPPRYYDDRFLFTSLVQKQREVPDIRARVVISSHSGTVVVSENVTLSGNFFFHNDGGRRFVEQGAESGLAYDRVGNATGAMGIDAGRYRNNADVGFLIGNFANEMTSMYVSQGNPELFADEAIGEGIGAPSRGALTFGLFLFDADLDGRLDVLQTNGHLEEEISKVDPSQTYRQAAQLFWNAGPEHTRTFVEMPAAAVGDLATPIVGRGSAYADLDGDGDLDVVLTQTGGAPLVLRNDQALGHHWLRLKLVGDPAAGTNRDAVGARVELTAGGLTQSRTVMPSRSYLSQSELPVTFGVGTRDRVDRVVIDWPSGRTEEFTNVAAGQAYRCVEGKGVGPES